MEALATAVKNEKDFKGGNIKKQLRTEKEQLRDQLKRKEDEWLQGGAMSPSLCLSRSATHLEKTHSLCAQAETLVPDLFTAAWK
jgi:hypothetical protein